MSKVASDLESLIAFREHLLRFNRTLAEEFSSMRGHWQELGDVWTDAKYHEFGSALNDVAQGINRYLATTEGQEAYLLRQIEALRTYLDTHA